MNKTRLAAFAFSALAISMANAAQYNVVELEANNKGLNVFPSDINASGEISVNVATPFNPPIDASLLNFESQTLIDGLTDIEAAKIGNYNDADYTFLYRLIAGNREGLTNQQIANRHAYLETNNGSDFIPGFDVNDTDTNEYTFSNDTLVRGLNDAGTTVGSSFDVFYTLDYTQEAGTDITYVVNDFYSRAFATVNNTTIELPPIDDTAGGLSAAYDINNNNQVVGYSTAELNSTTLQLAVDNCNDDDVRGDEPAEVCLRRINIATSTGTSSGKALELSFQRRGTIWQLDNQGQIISTKELGLLYTPEADDIRNFESKALAINDNGVAVGESQDQYRDTVFIRTFAAVFDGDTVTGITDDQTFTSSTATDINNNGLVVGSGVKQVNGISRSKFFVYDINTNETTFPEDFFLGSSSVAKAINNSGLVVGKGEVETGVSARRSQAFLYDTNTSEFTNLNDLIQCNAPYTLVDAGSINDDGVIAASALVRVAAQNISGENVIDSNGDEVIIDKIISVRLQPIPGGTIDDCGDTTPDDVEVVNTDRKGAGFGILSLVVLMMVAIRRRVHK
ncbi:DUF3466 family protein [Paraglaciecola polaris]|mgnify:CR=1 FL=1|uniref:DUF3466 family protein n=1 Tax=Paraglaciecola polaris LMG 21857 TaxID=1129793 RepID=K6Z9G2_9ALTE|nr:DUF3466 family protein [Paraglaciecola polaris]GAC32776.1 hypothetical protein GPLA_1869 [Paraglaciecola polaris LMG 21857]|tara:strand:+ start:5241 stop:6938 length:1698 start_codon:yes stop_codon:yes gene_type:complete